MTTPFERQFVFFVRDLERTRDCITDLWTWLPSFNKIIRCTGSYTDDLIPSSIDIIKEAIEFIRLKCKPSDLEIENNIHFQCPCYGNCPKQHCDTTQTGT